MPANGKRFDQRLNLWSVDSSQSVTRILTCDVESDVLWNRYHGIFRHDDML